MYITSKGRIIFVSLFFRDPRSGLAERSKMWNDRKEKKINVEREALMERQLENCTFQPDIVIYLIIINEIV
jgi:hypothetical protein